MIDAVAPYFNAAREMGISPWSMLGWGEIPTDRQLQAFIQWQQSEWNNPGRLEHYLMLLTGEVIKGRLKNPRSFDWRKLKIRFDFKQQRRTIVDTDASPNDNPSPMKGPRRLTKDDILKMRKADTLVRLGYPAAVIKEKVWGNGNGT